MIATKEIKEQNGDIYSSSKKQTSLGMTEATRQPSGRPDSNLFFQRNLGNSFLQSIAGGQAATVGGVPKIQRQYSCEDSCSDYEDKEDESITIQPKLMVWPANDVYEQEADRVAEQVIRMPDLSVPSKNQSNGGINIQRLSNSYSGTQESPPGLKLNQSSGRPLSTSTRTFMEPRFGINFSHVQIHTDQEAHETASRIKAKAFTYGNHIWLGKADYGYDNELMAHELTHVVQQNTTAQKLVQKRCGEATPPAENHDSIRNEICNQAVSQVGEHYLLGAEGESPGLGDVIMAPELQGVAKISGGCVCAGKHSQPEVTALPHLEMTVRDSDLGVYCLTNSFLRYEGAGSCGGGCGSPAGSEIWGECCIGHRHFDCSGFIYWSYNQAGYNISRTNVAGYQGCDRNINQADLQPGDLCYIGNHHVGIYAGGGEVYEARAHNYGVVITNFADRGWTSFGTLF